MGRHRLCQALLVWHQTWATATNGKVGTNPLLAALHRKDIQYNPHRTLVGQPTKAPEGQELQSCSMKALELVIWPAVVGKPTAT